LAFDPDVWLLPSLVDRLRESFENRAECGLAISGLWQVAEERSRRILVSVELSIDRRRKPQLPGQRRADSVSITRRRRGGTDGAALLYRRAMLEDVKIQGQYFDEQFFAHVEDIELAWRARLLGWRRWYEPAATAFHDRTFKPDRRRAIPAHMRRMAVKNRYLMLLKNEGREEWRREWWRILAYDLAIWGYILLLEQSSLGALAFRDGSGTTPGPGGARSGAESRPPRRRGLAGSTEGSWARPGPRLMSCSVPCAPMRELQRLPP